MHSRYREFIYAMDLLHLENAASQLTSLRFFLPPLSPWSLNLQTVTLIGMLIQDCDVRFPSVWLVNKGTALGR